MPKPSGILHVGENQQELSSAENAPGLAYADIGSPESWAHREGAYQRVVRTPEQAAEIASILDTCLKWGEIGI
jgi:hypothetical protein